MSYTYTQKLHSSISIIYKQQPIIRKANKKGEQAISLSSFLHFILLIYFIPQRFLLLAT